MTRPRGAAVAYVDQYPGEQVELESMRFTDDGTAVGARLNGARQVTVRAGNRGVHRVVPPAGEDYAYDRQEWARTVSVYVSPTGRSVRVWVDGREVPPVAGSDA